MATKLKIVDVSQWQAGYKFGKVGEDGIVVKATQSVDYINPVLKKQLEPPLKANKPVGVYHYATLDTTPERQAKYFYNVCRDYFKHNNCIAALDYEADSRQSTVFVKRFAAEFKKLTHGGTLWVYGGQNVINGCRYNQNPLWLSYYPFVSTEATPSNWEEPNLPVALNYPLTMWQYTTSGNKLDRNFFYGNFKTWQKLSVKGVK